jgi:hypothetical protein
MLDRNQRCRPRISQTRPTKRDEDQYTYIHADTRSCPIVLLAGDDDETFSSTHTVISVAEQGDVTVMHEQSGVVDMRIRHTSLTAPKQVARARARWRRKSGSGICSVMQVQYPVQYRGTFARARSFSCMPPLSVSLCVSCCRLCRLPPGAYIPGR